jgi:hypothetical protein
LEPEGLPNVVAENDQEKESKIEEVSMDILDNERKGIFPPVMFSRFAYGAGRRIGPKGLVVGTPIIITGETKPPRGPEDEQGRREGEQGRPPARFGAEPTMRRVTEDLRGIEGRKIGPIGIMISLKGRPGGVDDESAETNENDQRLNPPRVGASGLTESVLAN